MRHFISVLFFFIFPLLNVFSQDATANEVLNYIENLSLEIENDPSRQTGNLNMDSLASLPIGIVKPVGGKVYIICIDSARFKKNGAYFDAYAAIEMPGADRKLAFRAKDIKFNPKGVVGGEQAKLYLVTEQIIKIGPKVQMRIPGDGTNFVEWDCNGFKGIQLRGIFEFSNEIIQPEENSGNSVVTADFQVYASDLQNMMCAVTFSPFTIKGMKNVVFTVDEAYVDMSDYSNPLGMVLPSSYNSIYGDSPNLWRGFYIKSFNVKMPNELNKNNQPLVISADHLIIDDAGVTGTFSAQNLLTLGQGDASSWGFSIDDFSMGFVTNELTNASMAGKVDIPSFNNSILYEALMFKDDIPENDLPPRNALGYMFNIKMGNELTVTIDALQSSATLYNTSVISMKSNGSKFVPKAILNGKINIENNLVKLDQINFQNLTFIHQSPYVSEGYFSLVSSSGNQQEGKKLANFPIQISNLGFGIIANKPALSCIVALKLGEESNNNSFSCSTEINLKTKFENVDEKLKWKFDSFNVSTINLAAFTSVIHVKGFLNIYDDDPVFGKGFMGQLGMKIPNVIDTMMVGAAYGKINAYKYWRADVAMPTIIPLGAFTINRIIGGVSYHMAKSLTNTQMINKIEAENSGLTSGNTYVPDQSIGLSLTAGVGFKNTADEKILNGDLVLGITFNSSGGLNNINLAGKAYMMVGKGERTTSNNKVEGTLNINYDNQAKILDAQLSASVNFNNKVTGSAWANLYFSPGLWFVHIGSPTTPCSLAIANLASISAYLMTGQNLPPMPPPPPAITNLFGSVNSNRNTGNLASGSGFAMGSTFYTGFDKQFQLGSSKWYPYGAASVIAGFDMTIYKYGPNAYCSGSPGESFGMKGWFLNGQIYTSLNANIGIKKIVDGDVKNDLNVMNSTLAVLFQGKLPNPSYVTGMVYCSISVANLINVNFNFDFDLGTECTVVN